MPDSQMTILDDFKGTEIGLVPVDWDVVPLRKAAKRSRASTNPQSSPEERFDYYSIPAYQLSPEPLLERGGEIRSQKLIVQTGMVLFGKLNPRVPKVWLVASLSSRRKIASTEFIPLIPVEGRTSARFLYYLAWSHHVLPKSQELVSGSTPSRQRVDVEAFLDIPIPLPPLPEQRRIAEVLSTIQHAIEAQDKVIAAAEELRRSLMQRLFTYGPGPEPAPTKETEIGDIPEHWVAGTLDHVKASQRRAIVSGPFGSNIGKRFFVDHGVPLIRGNNLTKGEALFLDSGFVFITEEKAQELANCTALPGDLVFTAAGTIGQVGLVPEDCTYPKYIISNKQLRARVDTTIAHPLYLFYWFTHDRMQLMFQQRRRGSSIPVINLGILRNLPIAFPPLPQQRKIAEMLSTVDQKIGAEENRKAALQELFKSMLHQLMTGQLRVKDIEV